MRKKKRIAAAVFLSLMMVVLTACGNDNGDVQETVAPVGNEADETEDEAAVEEEAEDPEKEEAEELEKEEAEDSEKEEARSEETEIEEPGAEEIQRIPYAEKNELEFCKDLTTIVGAVRADINDSSVYERIDVECVIKDVSIEDTEDGFKTITIKYEVTGELYDSYEKRLLYVIMPHAAYCDLNTGEFQPIDDEIMHDSTEETDYTVEWNGEIYNIIQTRTMEWSPEPDWSPDGKNGYVAPVTMYVTDSFAVPKDYDSMGMVIGMFAVEETYSGNYEMFGDNSPLILEILENRKDARLYSVNELCKLFSEGAVAADNADTNVNTDNSNAASANNGGSKANTNNSSSKDSTTPKQEQQTAHTHSYSSSVTRNPSCVEDGVMAYTCSCGSSYTEAIPALGHQWTTTVETISHPSTGHYETVTKKEAFCGCGASGFQSQAEINAHWENDDCGGTTGGVREWTENVWVVDSDEWTESINITKCAVCGAQG